MRKSTKGRKNRFKINGNFFIFQGIMIALISYLTWGSWVKFIVFVILEIVLYCTLISFFVKKQAKEKSNKKRKYSEEVYRKVKGNTKEYSGVRETIGLNRIGRKNFNWEISKQDQNKLDKNLETSEKESSGLSYANETQKSALQEQTKKFVPYRSPFDPITPKEDKKETEKETQNTLDGVSQFEEENKEVESTGKDTEIRAIKAADIDKDIDTDIDTDIDVDTDIDTGRDEDFNASFDEGMGSSIDEDINTIHDIDMDSSYDEAEDARFDNGEDRGFNTVEETGPDLARDISRDPGFDAVFREIMVKNAPSIQMDCDEKKDMAQGEAQRNNSFKEDRKAPVKIHSDSAEYKPTIDLLNKNEVTNYDEDSDSYIEYNSYKLIDTLASFGVGAKVLNVSKGPTITRYELQPNAGVKVSKIINLADDIALNLAATGVRIEAPIPGKAAVGIEIPNKKNIPVYLRDVIEDKAFQNHPSKLAFAVGKDIAGNVVVGDIAKMPHLLIAGATGSGKSVCINTLIVSILYKASPEEVRLLMVDPKVVELGIYNGIPHLLIPVVTEPKKAAGALNWAVNEMTTRYRLFAENNVRDLSGYNEMIRERGEGETLPQIVIIIDELADLMMVAPNEVEDSICRLAQMARAAGMHLVIATQRPSVNVITGVIKANIPSRISFAVSSQIDSRTILDMAGAEKLLGRGDMLFYPLGQPKPLRVQGSFISDKEVDKIVTHIKSLQNAEYDEEILQKIDSQTETPRPDTGGDDELLPQAIATVLEMGQASASLIQRKFKVGYSRAARILDQMESWGVVSASDGSSKPRQILITRQEWEELNS